jgi:hypothetical protein
LKWLRLDSIITTNNNIPFVTPTHLLLFGKEKNPKDPTMHETIKNIFSSPNVAKKMVKLPLTKFAMKGPLLGIIQNPLKAKLEQQLL